MEYLLESILKVDLGRGIEKREKKNVSLKKRERGERGSKNGKINQNISHFTHQRGVFYFLFYDMHMNVFSVVYMLNGGKSRVRPFLFAFFCCTLHSTLLLSSVNCKPL